MSPRWPGREHEERHQRAASEHLLAEIVRAEAIRDREPAGSIQRLDAERYIAELHERIRQRRSAA